MEPEEPLKTPPSGATRLSGVKFSAQDLEARGGDVVHRSSTTVLRLKDLPPNVAEALASLDVDGDGTIDVGELHYGAKETERTVSKSKFYRKMMIILLGVCLAQLASFCGVMVGSINLTKESHVYDGRMTTRDGLNVVQTAQATSSLPLSSMLSDDAFLELKTVGLTSPTGATLHLTVLGFLRLPGAFGTVTLITHIGRIVLDGTSLSYIDDTQQAIFEAAGFSVNGATRRLLQVRALFGIFNAISAVSAAGINSTVAVAPPSLPDNFIMFAQRLTPCVPVRPPAGRPVPLFTGNYTGGPLPRTGVDLCDVLNIDDSLLSSTYNDDGSLDQRFIAMSYTMYRIGSSLLRVEYAHPLVPGQILVEVLDASNASAPVQFSYQVNSTDRGIQLVGGSDIALPALVGPIAYYNSTQVSQQDLVSEALGSPMDYLGNTSLAGEDVRIWAVHLNNNTMTSYWYDSSDTQEVRRIALGDFGILEIISISALDGLPEDNLHLFMQPDASATNVGDATTIHPGDALPAPLPTMISLDPFAPFIAEFKVAPARRRRLLEMKQQAAGPAEVHLDMEALANSSFAGLQGRRGLLQYTGGCSATNKCPIKPGIFPGGGGYGNQAVTLAIPCVPLGFAIGPVSRTPCMYEMSVTASPMQVGIPLPISITGTLGVLLCSDLSGYEQIYSSLSAAIGIPGITSSSPLSLFSWQIGSVGLSLVNEIQELQCTVDSDGTFTSSRGDAALLGGMVSRFGTSAARSNCQCLRNTGQRSGIGFTSALALVVCLAHRLSRASSSWRARHPRLCGYGHTPRGSHHLCHWVVSVPGAWRGGAVLQAA